MSSDDPFLKKIKAKEARFTDALLWGFSESRGPSDLNFVKSCQDFFDSRGYLTEKQIAALFNMDKSQRNYYDDED